MNVSWKKRSRKVETIILAVFILLLVLITSLSDVLFPGTPFAAVVDDTVGKFFNLVQFFTTKYVQILESFTIIFFMWLISKALRLVISLVTKIGQKSATIGLIVNSVIKYGSSIIAIFLILAAWGVQTSTLLAGAGIFGLAISFGAQSLIEDVISGLFIIFEKDFQVGDVIEVDGFRGTVVAVGIRTTKIEDLSGDIKIINNSEIRGAVNTSNNLHPAICDFSVSYDTDLENLERLVHAELPHWREVIPDIQEGPFYKGVQNLADSGVVIRILARVEEMKKYQVVRDLNREMKLFCDRNGIEIPYNQLVVHLEKASGKGKSAEAVLPDPVFLAAAENGVKVEPPVKKPRVKRPEVPSPALEPLKVQEEETPDTVPSPEAAPAKKTSAPKKAAASPAAAGETPKPTLQPKSAPTASASAGTPGPAAKPKAAKAAVAAPVPDSATAVAKPKTPKPKAPAETPKS